jgi:hypothetical protein
LKAVNQGIALATQDVRFNSDLGQACSNDRQTLCKDVPPVCCYCFTTWIAPPAMLSS